MNTRKITCMAAAAFVGSPLVLSTVAPAHAQAAGWLSRVINISILKFSGSFPMAT